MRLRGEENVRKRYLIHAAAFNLGLLMRQMLGAGTPRELANAVARARALLLRAAALWSTLIGWWLCRTTPAKEAFHRRAHHVDHPLMLGSTLCTAGTSTGC